MDWRHNSTEANRTVELAVIKLEATVSVTDPSYGGAVFVNPGGPGGSGVEQVLNGGHAIRSILSAGPEADVLSAKNFDIISFDPRGVNNTRPIVSCFPDRLGATVWDLEKYAEGFIGDTTAAFDNLWARYQGFAAGCSERYDDQVCGHAYMNKNSLTVKGHW